MFCFHLSFATFYVISLVPYVLFKLFCCPCDVSAIVSRVIGFYPVDFHVDVIFVTYGNLADMDFSYQCTLFYMLGVFRCFFFSSGFSCGYYLCQKLSFSTYVSQQCTPFYMLDLFRVLSTGFSCGYYLCQMQSFFMYSFFFQLSMYFFLYVRHV